MIKQIKELKLKDKTELEDIKKRIFRVLKKYGVVRAGIFGSYAKGENKKGSDIDMLVEFEEGRSLFDLVGLKLKLESLLKRKVDILTYKSIHHLLKKRIMEEEVEIL